MMKKNSTGTIYLKSGFHYKGSITAADSDWLVFLDKRTNKYIQIRLDAVDHFIPCEVEE
jgi:sRNA-binding regulator protein Hfq